MKRLGHGIGVDLDVYTIADLEQRQAAVNTLAMKILWASLPTVAVLNTNWRASQSP